MRACILRRADERPPAQFVDWAVERCILSPHLVEFVVLTFLLLLPGVIAVGRLPTPT